jgi:pilus assembly protein CpaC
MFLTLVAALMRRLPQISSLRNHDMISFQRTAKHYRFDQRSVGLQTHKMSTWSLKPLCASLLCICAGIALPVYGQVGNPSPGSSATMSALNGNAPADEKLQNNSAAPRNAYAENLRPKVKRAAALQNQPYAPIKKQDDQAQIPEIEMFVGESRVFPAPGVARIAVGNGQIMTAAALDSKEVLIFANGVGTSSLFVWNADGRYQRVKVNIVPGDTTRVAREVAAFLSTISNAKASIVGDKVIVEGDNLSDADLSKIEQLEKRYPQIVNFTNRLGWEKMVMMDVKVVEFPKDELREIGMKWGATGGAAVGAIWRPITRGSDGPYQINIQTGQSNQAPITNQEGTGGVVLPAALNIIGAMNLGLNAQLNLLALEGKASILAEPQLSARNGSKASFLAGGEFPYSISTINGVTVFFKPYGIKLDIVPKVDRNGVVRATIESEVSKIDSSVTSAGGPALLTRKTTTEFNVKAGETIVLAGLISLDSSTNIDKVPLLGDIPILGALFRSKRFQSKETELVIFVTPTVVDSDSPGLVDRVERATERLQQNFGKPPYLSNPLQPGQDPAKTGLRPQAKPQPVSTNTPSASAAANANIPVAVSEAAAVVPVSRAAPTRAASGIELTAATGNPLRLDKSVVGNGSVLRVKKDGLVIRAEPDVKSQALLQLGYGSVVQLGASDAQPPGQGTWRHVVVGEINGWVLSKWVEPSHLQPAIKSYGSSAVASIDQGNNVLALGPDAKGTRVSGVGVQAVTPGLRDNASANQGQPLRHYRVMLERVALRVTPDVNAPVVQNLAQGQLVEALPQAPRGHWIAVQVDGKRGWAASQWLNPVTSQN